MNHCTARDRAKWLQDVESTESLALTSDVGAYLIRLPASVQCVTPVYTSGLSMLISDGPGSIRRGRQARKPSKERYLYPLSRDYWVV
jgi:hypothetical protein